MIVAIIQARMGSTRFPGKILRDLAGRTVLAHVLGRARAIPGVDEVCCAVSDREDSDPVAREAARVGAVVVRGHEHDVLGRYVLAARRCRADVIMRITSDCPLLDPRVSHFVLARFQECDADYCSNVDPRSWPRGLDTEVFSRDVLEDAAETATDPSEREHVTSWIRRHEALRRCNVECDQGNFSGFRWTLDYPDDLDFLRRVYEHLPSGLDIARFEHVLAVVSKHPEITSINAGHASERNHDSSFI